MNQFKCFKLPENTKIPNCRWLDGKDIVINELPKLTPTKQKGIVKGYNLGIYTGKTNNITVIDIDYYKMDENNKFLKDFGLDYILNQNTFTVKTQKGGYHLYFEYDEEIKTTTNKDIEIDIRNDGAFVVSFKSIINDKKYEIINNKPVNKINSEFKNWLLTNLYEVRPTIKKDENNKIIYQLNNINYSDDFILQFKNNLEKTKKNLFKKNNGFLKFTNCCKILNLQTEWDNYNKTQEGYNYENNFKIWNSLKTEKYNFVNCICKELEIDGYLLYKPTLKNLIKENKEIDFNKLPYTFYTDLNKEYFKVRNYIIKSDTGTGKTTSFKKYIKNTNQKFISIVSRVSLGLAQYITFGEDEINSKFYQYENKFNKDDNIIIQLDSIKRLCNIDFTNYIIFLDEFNSIIEYLISSSTLNNSRLVVYKILIRILKECKQVICVDADITDICLNFLNYNNIQFNFINNLYKHNKGVIAEELNGVELFYNKIKTEDKFLACFDSKTEAEILHQKLKNDDIDSILITSDSGDEYINFDEHDKIIYSPKIVYGIDSVMKRPVYCYYKSQTINPKSMVQQIARCRNITNLYYYFSNKKYNHNKYTLKEIEENMRDTEEYSNSEFKFIAEKETYENYFKLIVKYEYNNISYNTNKFSHFLNILDERGFIRNKEVLKEIKKRGNNKEIKEEIKEEKYLNFNPEKYPEILEILNISNKDSLKYIDFFIEKHKLLNHLNICYYMFEDENKLKGKLADKLDFNIKKIKDEKSKVLFLKQIKKLFNNPEIDFIKSKGVSVEESKKINKEFSIYFSKVKECDFTNSYECDKLQYKIYNSLFGFNIVKSKKDSKQDENGFRKNIYTVDTVEIDLNKNLFQYRKNKNSIEFL